MKVIRYDKNPVVAPIKKFEARFNPAVIIHKGKVLLYARVVDDYCKYISRIDLYESEDGLNFKLIKEGVIKPDRPEDKMGCEDPRVVKIGEKYYMTYTALSTYAWGNPHPKVMLVEIDDPYNFNSYKKLGIITSFSKDDKDVVLFPEKINDNYLMLHRPSDWGEKPSIWLSHSKNLLDWNGHKKVLEPEYNWEELKVGAGCPPIKTEFGWILIYHGVDSKYIYRVGLAILDLKEPWKIIYKHPDPIWEPKEWYERYGDIPNVIFPTGAFIKDNKIWIYAGTTDKYISLAFLDLEELKDELKRKGII